MADESIPGTSLGHAGLTVRVSARPWPALLARGGALAPLVLYLLGVTLLTARLGSHPAFPYNWESYTAQDVLDFWARPSWSIVHLTDGVMTDSGRSPLIALPIWVSFKLLGVHLAAMRLPIVLLAGLAVPLTWLVGRRLAGPGAALLGAVLLALSPVFLLYGRTATLVGLSLVPALLTIHALLRVLERPRDWRWLIALQVVLLLDAYAYSPIRFLWPLSLVLVLGEALWRRGERRWLLVALVATALVLPLGITGAYRYVGYRGWDKTDPAIVSYYSGHGEQLANLRNDPTGIERYIRPDAAGGQGDTTTRLALRLVWQNATDLGRLLTDRQTLPAITDYWNEHGRLYPWYLVPFFLIGSLVTFRRAFTRVEARAWLVLFWGLSLPMLLTSRVHIGRLIFIVPLLMLFVAVGMIWIARISWIGVTKAFRRTGSDAMPAGIRRIAVVPRIAAVLAVVIALSVVAKSTWADYGVTPNAGAEAKIAGVLASNAASLPPGAGLALVLAPDASGRESEALTVSGIQVMLDGAYRFVDLGGAVSGGSGTRAATRPPVYYGGLLSGSLTAPATMPTFCQNVYIVPTGNFERFKARTSLAATSCLAPLRVVVLPD